MIVRRAANAAATLIVAIVVALTVPIGQLTTVSVQHTCCCPDPDDCHCPHDKPDRSSQPSMRTCHQQTQLSVGPQLPSFAPPPATDVAAQPAVAPLPMVALADPHASPAPIRPDAPS